MSKSGDHDFSSATSDCNVCLVVEERMLYTCRSLLCEASPVFKSMFEGDYKEKTATDIPLPGKKYVDIIELLRCITPPQGPVTEDNLCILLPLADEYLMDNLKTRITDYISEAVGNRKAKTKEVFRYMLLAKQYKVSAAYEACLNIIKIIDFDRQLKLDDNFLALSSDIKCDIMTRRLTTIEVPLRKFVSENSDGVLQDAFEKSMAYHCEGGHKDSDAEEDGEEEEECCYEHSSYCLQARREAESDILGVAFAMAEANKYFEEVKK